jgi:hypothetical protein
MYEANTCQVVHEGKLSDTIAVNTGMSQGSILSPIIFLMVMDDIYINKYVNVRLCKILNCVQKRKSPKIVHRLLCNFDTTLHVITRVFLYTYLYI